MRKAIPILIVAFAVAVTAGLTGDNAVSQVKPSSQAYDELRQELQTMQRGAQSQRNMQRQLEIVEQMANKLSEFILQYPGTEEALDANFQLGVLYYNLQRPAEAIEPLTIFINQGAAGSPREKAAVAYYFLGEAYKATNEFDRAKVQLQIVLNEYADVGGQVVQLSRMSLQDMDVAKQLAVGSEPIAFEVKSITGQTLSPSAFKGKVLLLDFWATWCGPCIKEMPTVKKVYDKYNDKGFEIIGISLDRQRASLDNYIETNEIAWPQYFDGKYWQNEIALQYRVRSIPATYLIDKKGKIRYKSLRGHQLEVAVQKLIDE